jgi:hypothetical protein
MKRIRKMPKLSTRKRIMKDITKKILSSDLDPFLILLEWDKEELENLTSSDVGVLMDVRGDK